VGKFDFSLQRRVRNITALRCYWTARDIISLGAHELKVVPATDRSATEEWCFVYRVFILSDNYLLALPAARVGGRLSG